jgi:fatty-acid peroxygenase
MHVDLQGRVGDAMLGRPKTTGMATTALAMLAAAVRTLARLPTTLPPQDLDHDLSRIPTRPRSGVVLDTQSR